MDITDYNFDDLGLLPYDSTSLDDGILLPVCWIDDDGHFLSIP